MNDTIPDLSGRPRLALAGAVGIVVLVVAAVVVFGLVPYPDLPTVEEVPDPPLTARLALMTFGMDGPCLDVVEPDGERRQVACGSQFEGFGLSWLNDDEVRIASGFDERRHLAVDVDTGAIRTVEAPEETSPPDDSLMTVGQDGRTAVEVRRSDGSTEVLFELEGPARYSLFQPMSSSDGRWVVVQDSIGRVLVVPSDGGPVRVWLDDDDNGVGEIAVS